MILLNSSSEIDVVINVTKLKEKKYKYLEKELSSIVKVSRGKALVKVIIETCLLTPAEIKTACEVVYASGVDFVKTSTGFSKYGARVEDVFVYHKVYNVVKVKMDIKSRRDVSKYMEGITSGKSTNLMNLTSNYHYHTVVADDEQTLDLIQEELKRKGFLAQLQDFEPIDFWSDKARTVTL